LNKISLKILIVFILISTAFYFFSASNTKHSTAIIWNPISQQHTMEGQPENANRVRYIIEELKHQKLWNKVAVLQAREATDAELSLAHSKTYINRVKQWAEEQKDKYLTAEKWSPYNGPHSAISASTAAGGLIQLTEAVAKNEYKNGFAIIRPPGHHATSEKGMGYCIYNNISIASLNLLNKKLASRILIVDMDAHHGNGIEEILKGRSDVMYMSFHQQWMFPYTGEKSFENIQNYNLKFLMPENFHLDLFNIEVTRVAQNFKPDFILVSAGYDSHWRDFMSNLGLSTNAHALMSQKLIALADEYSAGKIVFSLEGGYDLEALANGVSNSIKALLKRDDFIDTIGKAPQN